MLVCKRSQQCTFVWFILTFISLSAAVPSFSGARENDCSCSQGNDVTLVVSTLDGSIFGINALNGQQKWSFDPGQGPLLSSSLDQILVDEGDSVYRVIPSLDGNLYKLYDESVLQGIPLSADALLSSSLKIGNDAIAGGKDIRTFGLDAKSGQVMYECGSEGCSYFEEATTEEKLIIRRTSQTVRAVDAISGYERWNVSVSKHHLAAASSGSRAPTKCKASCDEREKWLYRSTDFSSHGSHGALLDELNWASLKDLEFRAVPPSGEVKAFSKSAQMDLWTKNLEVPIAQLWLVSDGDVTELSLFDPRLIDRLSLVASVAPDAHAIAKSGFDDSMVYVGTYNSEQYVIVSESERERMQRLAASSSVMSQHDANRFYQGPNPNLYFSCSAISSGRASLQGSSVADGCPLSGCTSDQANALILRSEHSNNMGWYLYKHRRPEHLDSRHWENSGLKRPSRTYSRDRLHADTFLSLQLYWKEIMLLLVLLLVVTTFVVLAFFWKHRDELLSSRTRTDSSGIVMVSVKSQASMSNGDEHTESHECAYTSRYLNDFEPLRCLGKGGFGVVFESRNKLDDCKYAIKRIAVVNRPTAKEKVMREVKALAKLDHVGIVRYYQSWFESPPRGWQEHTDAMIIHQSVSATGETPLPVSGTVSVSNKLNLAKKETGLSDLINEVTGTPIQVSPTHTWSVTDGNFKEGDISTTRDSGLLSKSFRQPMEFHGKEIDSASESNPVIFCDEDDSDCPKKSLTQNGDMLSSGNVVFDVAQSDNLPSTPELRRRKNIPMKDRGAGDFNIATKDKELQTPSGRIYLYIQMQLCHEHTLRHWLAANVERDNVQMLDWFKQIVSAVQYVHDSGLIHRDLKPSNIFFSLSGQIKIGDFGLVTATMPDDPVGDIDAFEIKDGHIICNPHVHTDRVGTRLYMSPEQQSRKVYTQKVDIYALGLIFFELLVSFATEMERVKTLEGIRKGKFPRDFQSKMPNECKLVRWLTAEKEEERPDCQDIITEVESKAKEMFCHNLM